MGPLLVILVGSYAHIRPSQTHNVMIMLAVSLYGYANAALTLIFVAPYRDRTKQNCLWIAAKLRLCRNVDASCGGASGSKSTPLSLSVRRTIAVVPTASRTLKGFSINEPFQSGLKHTVLL